MSRRILLLLGLTRLALVGADTSYEKPAKEILDVLHAPASPMPSVNTSRTHVLLLERQLYPPIAELAAPMLRLAGLRINPSNSSPHTQFYSFYSGTILDIATGRKQPIQFPPAARFGEPAWSPDGRRFAVANTTPSAIELWVGDAGSATLKKIPGIALNETVDELLTWFSSSDELLVLTVPKDRGSAPTKPATPASPNIQESGGQAEGAWTFQDLLTNAHDEVLFDHYGTSQLAAINVVTGKTTSIGKPGIYARVSPSPDGKNILISRIHRPYSYVLPFYNFPREIEVWDRAGQIYKAASVPLGDKVPVDGVVTTPRNHAWRPTENATLLWWEALDGGDPKRKVPHRDRLMMLKAPFNGSPAEITKTQQRAVGIQFGEKGGLALVTDYERERRWRQTLRIFLDDPQAKPKLIWSLDSRDRYQNPGTVSLKTLPNGKDVLEQDGDWILLNGQGATPEGDRPFLDRMNLETGQTERLFQSGTTGYEQILASLSADGSRMLTSYETPDTPPNLFLRTKGSDERKALTGFKDPTAQLHGITKRLVKYKRPDGVDLSFTLYLPPGYKEGTRLPAIVWAYPLEYNDPATAGQVMGSPQRFTSMRGPSHLFLLLAGYAVLENATIPIIGDFETVNNTYVEQLTAGAKAAIDKAAELGVADPARVGAMGHSYGGFMTANLLAHTDLFRAGVARSGAYNRTLTPFGFQSERRTFWQAREAYMRLSPFTYADKINEPILLIHGEADNNAGTFPVQSERLYQAVRGNGGVVRLVMLPHEAHGYRAKESIEHVLRETIAWFDKYVKNAPALTSAR